MMASAPGPAATSGSTPTNLPSPVAGQKDGTSRTSMRSTATAKATERGRKESPVDAGSRRPPSQKAWASGTNPLTQRGSTPVQQNGNMVQTKTTSNVKMPSQKETGLSDKHAHDRLRFILAGAVGLSVVITTKAGDVFDGVFSGSTLTAANTKMTLKMTKKLHSSSSTQSNGIGSREAALVGASPDHAMTFDLRDMVDLAIPEFLLPEAARAVNGATATFQTDSDISGNANRAERTLQRWMPDGPADADLSLEATGAGDWDQFATHKQMFGGQSTYDENMYTTTIDRSSPSYKRREAEAARIAREIEGASSTNTHVREERGHTTENDFEDEEDKYSGVRREGRDFPSLPAGGAHKYTPPARRPPTGQPTIAGAPVDSAIISAQLSRPDGPKAAVPHSARQLDQTIVEQKPDEQSVAASTPNGQAEPSSTPGTLPGLSPTTSNGAEVPEKFQNTNASSSPHRKGDGPTDDVENKVLDQFRQFANAERQRVAERKRAQASQDRTAKLNDLLRFSKTFKLKTPIPTDLVGILAKDPMKQEAIIEKARQEHEDSASTTTSPSATPASKPPSGSSAASKPEPALTTPTMPDGPTFNRGRGGFPSSATRGDRISQQQPTFATRGPSNAFSQRAGGVQLPERKITQPISIPAPIPIHEGRAPPLGPTSEQPGLTSPQRSTMHTPTSAVSSKFNVRAMEFRPNVNAPAFNPAASTNAPSSPASVQRTESLSRAASPSTFFGSRTPKPAGERPSLTNDFNPIKRMREEFARRKTGEKGAKGDEPQKDYSYNGGIPNAYHTGPRWIVKAANSERTYLQTFERPPPAVASPAQSRSGSTQHMPYQGQGSHMGNGGPAIPQISTPHHAPHGPHHYSHQFDDGHQRMQMQGGSPQVYPSPNMSSRQMSAYASPMGHPAQLAYGQPQYFGNPAGQMSMQMRQYPHTPGMMHAQPGQLSAPLMVQQQSNGSYIAVPQQYNPQMNMYSPSPGHAYPQSNGYPSPGRGAPMMLQQASQPGHHPGPAGMYSMPGQGAPMGYPQPGQMMRGGYGAHHAPYGTSPHQPHHLQQRAMSSGYGPMTPKGMQQPMTANAGPPLNAPQQPAAYAQMGLEDGKSG